MRAAAWQQGRLCVRERGCRGNTRREAARQRMERGRGRLCNALSENDAAAAAGLVLFALALAARRAMPVRTGTSAAQEHRGSRGCFKDVLRAAREAQQSDFDATTADSRPHPRCAAPSTRGRSERRSAEHLRTALHCIHDCIPVHSIHSALLKVLLSITRPATLSLFNAVIRPRSNHSVHLVPALRPSFCATSRSLCCSYLCNEFHLHTSWRPPTGSHPAVVTSSQS